jgi:hypothetical protein
MEVETETLIQMFEKMFTGTAEDVLGQMNLEEPLEVRVKVQFLKKRIVDEDV